QVLEPRSRPLLIFRAAQVSEACSRQLFNALQHRLLAKPIMQSKERRAPKGEHVVCSDAGAVTVWVHPNRFLQRAQVPCPDLSFTSGYGHGEVEPWVAEACACGDE